MSCLTFRATSLLVLFLLLAGSALQTQATELRCKCPSVVSHIISTRDFETMKFIPEGPHCIRSEVIVTKKDGKEICLNPTMPWVQIFIQRFVKRTGNL
ncbi:interleukin-8-like [Erythrolamprus reginae]|uniref:interleukin-8-like n=1 Tax=Erythrolamprus reginae TaxID=121349 RepID=UPI00396C5900